MLVAGEGLMLSSDVMAKPFIESGMLRRVLAGWTGPDYDFSAVFAGGGMVSPKVRAFVDWVTELFAACPLLGGRAAVDYCCSYEGPCTGNTLRSVAEQHNLAESVL